MKAKSMKVKLWDMQRVISFWNTDGYCAGKRDAHHFIIYNTFPSYNIALLMPALPTSAIETIN